MVKSEPIPHDSKGPESGAQEFLIRGAMKRKVFGGVYFMEAEIMEKYQGFAY
jgi:hypothetical protein